MTTRPPPVELAHRCGPLAHAIAPGQCIGGPRAASALLMLFGQQLARELKLHERNPPGPETQRPRR